MKAKAGDVFSAVVMQLSAITPRVIMAMHLAMNRLVLFVSVLLLSSCHKDYFSPDAVAVAGAHKVIAVIPAEVTVSDSLFPPDSIPWFTAAGKEYLRWVIPVTPGQQPTADNHKDVLRIYYQHQVFHRLMKAHDKFSSAVVQHPDSTNLLITATHEPITEFTLPKLAELLRADGLVLNTVYLKKTGPVYHITVATRVYDASKQSLIYIAERKAEYPAANPPAPRPEDIPLSLLYKTMDNLPYLK